MSSDQERSQSPRHSQRLAAALACGVALAVASCAGTEPRVSLEPPAPPWSAPTSQGHPLVGRVFAPGTAGFVTPAEALERLTAADFVLLGEKHDNPDHHRLQEWLVSRLVAGGRRPALVLEMIDSDRAEAVSAHLRDNPGDAAGLGAAVEWSKSGWPDYAHYRPIVQVAVSAGLPVVAGNLPKALARRVSKEGPSAIDPETRQRLGLDQPPAPEAFSGLSREIRASHCGMLPEEAIPRMVETQRGRDASLAAAMGGPPDRDGGALLIAGAGHARTDWGVPSYLRRSVPGRAPGRTIVSLAFIEVDDDHPDAADYGGHFGVAALPFDLVWFTPRLDNDDPCAKLVEHMKGMKKK
ncbi:MAG: ChaN family lipoprotein [Alphaproteobacteria bacterium]